MISYYFNNVQHINSNLFIICNKIVVKMVSFSIFLSSVEFFCNWYENLKIYCFLFDVFGNFGSYGLGNCKIK